MKRLKLIKNSIILCVILAGFFALLFYTDNKYSSPPPYGKNGTINLTAEDFARNTPIFLIDGWLLSDENATNQPTWIGEFSNLQRGNFSVSPHGKAEYNLTLRYFGSPIIAEIEFHELFSDYEISVDGKVLEKGSGNGLVSFELSQGNHSLKVATNSERGYYSGMYYPPSIGTAATIERNQSSRDLAYAIAFCVPLVLAFFTILLWKTGGEIARWFAIFCGFFSLYISYYFVFIFHLPFQSYWFFIENIALYGLCFCVIQITSLSSSATFDKIRKSSQRFMVLLPCFMLLLCLLTPIFPKAVVIHGILTDVYYIVTFCYTIYFAIRGASVAGAEHFWAIFGSTVFGFGLIQNLLFSNRFEPANFFWQFEWCGLFLVLIFAAMMVAQNRRIIAENAELTNNLGKLVEKRTKELNQLIEERKIFFSDMAHDLKAPVYATEAFIEAIRRSGIGVDSDLAHYLDLAEEKQCEMKRRLQGLSAINELDKIESERKRISITELLDDIYAAHHSEAEVASIYFSTVAPIKDGYIFAQPEKLDILFENLIYNAIRATPPNGNIAVEASIVGGNAKFTVTDTGCGIAESDLPQIFRRFFIGAQNKQSGTGLGLYICKSIVANLGGTITATSKLNQGSCFTILIPLSIT